MSESLTILPKEASECVFETPTSQRIRKRSQVSTNNLRSHTKRRRLSVSALDLSYDENIEAIASSSATADRFIPNRPKFYMPLSITPRTNRIVKHLGLVDDRLLNFKDETGMLAPDQSTMNMIRKSASSLFNTALPVRPTSVMENLNKHRQCLMVLDSPGVPTDPECSPITWSRQNLIAVACGKSVYYQNLDTKNVSRLCSSSHPGYLGVARWGDEKRQSYMATGMSTGHLQVYDAYSQNGPSSALHSWTTSDDLAAVMSIAWNGDVLAVGMEDGELSLIDTRQPNTSNSKRKHHGRVLGLEWSPDSVHLASGDTNGMVCIWDHRNMSSPITKLQHWASTKALAWCPWKPELLATGSLAPEGKIRVWNTSSSLLTSREPAHTFPLNTSVFSLHWSPHCKELLSSHGPSFAPAPAPARRRTVSLNGFRTKKDVSRPQLTLTTTPLTNSITVHEYPSGKRLMTLPNAHTSEITQTCLGPTGETIFTFCAKEEAIKMWQVWSKRAPAMKKESAFDKFRIR